MMNRLRGMVCLGAIALATAAVTAQVATPVPALGIVGRQGR